MKKKINEAKASVAGAKAQQIQSGVVGSETRPEVTDIVVASEHNCENLMKMVESNGKKAFVMLQQIADKGNLEAMELLTRIYLDGDIIEGKEDEGMKYLKKMADLGIINALVLLGTTYLRNANSEEDHVMAFKFFHKAALLGHPESEMIVSALYSEGRGCKKNMMLAKIWAVKARMSNFSFSKVMEITGWDEGIDDNN
jgi:hypothetical protein